MLKDIKGEIVIRNLYCDNCETKMKPKRCMSTG